MPVRAILQNSRSVTGQLNAFCKVTLSAESDLESKFYKIARFALEVSSIEDQPVKIDCVDDLGSVASYCPDALLKFAVERKPILSEIKYVEDLIENWVTYKYKFKAAVAYASERGMIFKVFTEKDIDTPFLQNVRFFGPYRTRKSNPVYEQAILDIVSSGIINIGEVMRWLEHRGYDKETIKISLWQMISLRKLGCDFMQRINKETKLYSLREKNFKENLFSVHNGRIFSDITLKALAERNTVLDM